jgi:hypothetical protein
MKILEFTVRFSNHQSTSQVQIYFGVYGQVLQSAMHQSSAKLFWSLQSGSPISKQSYFPLTYRRWYYQDSSSASNFMSVSFLVVRAYHHGGFATFIEMQIRGSGKI